MPSWEPVYHNPILMLLEGNGSLAGRDRDGIFSATGSGALRYAPAPGARINYFPERTYTDDQTWTYPASPTSSFTVQPYGHYAPQCYRVVTTASQSFGFGAFTELVTHKKNAGKSYRISFNARSSYAGTFQYADWETFAPRFTFTLEEEEWTAIQFESTVPVGGFYGFDFYSLVAQPTGQWLEVSDIVVEADYDPSDDWWFEAECPSFNPVTGVLFANADGGPHAQELTFWIEEGTTNLLLNPSFEATSLHVVVSGGSVTASRVTSYSHYGNAALRVVTTGAVPNEYFYMPTATGLGYTGSASPFTGQVKLLGSGTVDVTVSAFYTDTTIETGTNTQVVLTGEWQEVVASLTLNPAKTVDFMWILVSTVGTQAITFYADGMQLEQKAYATSYCDGSLGTGYAWSGLAHLSASTRTVTMVTVPADTGKVDTLSGSVVTRSRRPGGADGSPRLWRVGNIGDNPGDWLSIIHRPTNVLVFESTSDGANFQSASIGSVAAGAWYLAALRWTDVLIEGNVDLGAWGSGVRAGTAGEPNPAATLGLGEETTIQNHNGLLGPVATYDRPLTDAELLDINDTITFGEDLWDALEDVGGPTGGGPMFSYGFSARPSAGVSVIDRRKKKRHVSLDVIMHPDDERVRRS